MLDRAIDLVPIIEKLSDKFPRREDFELGN